MDLQPISPTEEEITSAVNLLRSFAPERLARELRARLDAVTAAGEARSRSMGLAPWQLKRAKALIETKLCGGVAVDEIAVACRLSRSHFSHAFRASTGVSPHKWLVRRRIEKARELLCESMMPLSEIAVACGFCDQSHFTRQFTQTTGTTPRHWRRMNWMSAAA